MPYVYQTVKRRDEDGNYYTTTIRVWVAPKPVQKQTKGPAKPKPPKAPPKPSHNQPSNGAKPSPNTADAAARLAAAKRAADLLAKARRKALYDLIRKRQMELVEQRQAAEGDRIARENAATLSLEQRRREMRDATTKRVASMNETMNAEEARRYAILQRLRETGDYEGELRKLQVEQSRTGGRFLDKKSHAAIFSAYSAQLAQVQRAYDFQQERLRAIVKDGKNLDQDTISRARALLDDKDFKAAVKEYGRVYGRGSTPGEVMRVSALLNAIAKANDEYVTRAVLSMSPTDTGKAEVAREEIDARLSRATGARPSATPQREGNDQDLKRRPISLNEYLDEIERLRKIQEQKLLQSAKFRRNLLDFEGFDPDTGRDRVKDAFAERVKTVLKEKGLDAEEILRLLREGDSVDQSRALQQIREAMHGTLTVPNMTGREAYLKEKRGLDEQVYQNLLGQKAPDPFMQGLGDLFSMPVAHEAVTGLGVLSGGLFGLVRRAQLELGGRIVGPDLQFSELWEGRNPIRIGEGRTTDEEYSHEAEAWNELIRLRDSGDFGKVLQGIANYGAEPFQSNVFNLAAPSILDPLNFVGPARYLARARIAARELGGLDTVLRGNLRQFGGRFNEFLKNPAKFRSAQILDDINVRHGTNFKTLGEVDELVIEAERVGLLKHPDKVTETQGLERLWKGKPEPDSRQLVVAVSKAIGEYIGARPGAGRLVKDLEVQTMVRRAEKLIHQSDRKIRIRTEKLTQAQDMAAGERALAAARADLGRPGAAAPAAVPPRRKRAIAAHETAFRRVDEDLRVTAEKTKRAVATLRDSQAKPEDRRAAFDELAPLLDELDTFHTIPAAPATATSAATKTVIGRLDASETALNTAFGRLGLPRLGSRLVGPKPATKLIAEDIRDVDGLIKLARADLSAATTAATKDAARERLRMLGAARRQLDRERLRAEGQTAVAKDVVQRYGKQAEQGVPTKRLAARVKTKEGADQEFVRDLHTTYTTSLIDGKRGLNPLDPAEHTKLANVRTTLHAKPMVITTVLEPFRDVLEDATVWEALHLMHLDALPIGGGPRAIRAVEEEIARQAGLGGKLGVVKRIMEMAEREHHYYTMTLDEYERIDAAIVKAFDARDRKKRRGALDFKTKTPKGGKAKVFASHEGALETLDIMRAAAKDGATIFAYGDARTVLRNATLRKRTTKSLHTRVDKRVAAGEDFDAAWDDEVAKQVTYEAVNDLERFAMHPRFENMTAREIWEVFEDLNLESDLIQSTAVRSEWSMKVLKRAIADTVDTQEVLVDDLSYMRRALGGVMEEPRGARFPTQDELDAGLAGLNTQVPVFIVPDTSKYLNQSGGWAFAIHAQGLGVFVSESNAMNPAVVLHEVGHALVHNAIAANEPALRQLRAHITVAFNGVAPVDAARILGYTPHGLDETVAELYGRWASGPRPLVQTIPGSGVTDILTTWDDIKAALPGQAPEFAAMESLFHSLIHPTARKYGVDTSHVPPVWDRPQLYQWLVDNGYWRPRTGQKIREGSRVWSIDEERAFFEGRFGFTPPWADRDVLREVLHDPNRYDAFWESVGVLDNGYEVKASQAHLDAGEIKDAQAFGDEAHGLHRRRSVDEQRRWFVERYGKGLVGQEDHLTAVPWLMDPRHAEYGDWVAKVTDENVPQTLVQGAEREAFVAAVRESVTRYVDRRFKDGTIDPDDVYMPEEAMRLALDVVDELMYSKAWRSKWTLDGKLRQGANVVGDLQRLTVTFSIPFIIVNVLERFIFKPLLLGLRHGRELAGSFKHDIEAIESIPSLASVNLRQRGLWEFRTAGGFTRAKAFGLRDRRGLGELARAVKDSPFTASSIGEDALKLRFARGVFSSVKKDLLAEGATEELAQAVAMREARRLSLLNFPSLEDAGELEKALNQIVPFLSYNLKTGTLFLKTVVQHPGLLITMDRLGRMIEQENREAWKETHGDVPFPDEDARKLILKIGDFEYAIDVAQFSDVLRAGGRLVGQGEQTMLDWMRKLIRIPHPIQEGMFAMLTGQEGPWGPVKWTDFFWPAQFFGDLSKFQSGDMDVVEFLSQSLFWQRFHKLDPAQQGAQWYFALARMKRYDEAEQYLQDNPMVATYLLNQGVRPVRTRRDGSISLSWFTGKSPQEAAAWQDALAGLRELQSSFDAKLGEFYDKPWTDEYKMWKKLRRAAVESYFLEHPELTSAFALSRSWEEWQKELGEWVIDDLFEEFEQLQAQLAPKRTAFKDELDYRMALREYNLWRKSWLDAHPLVAERLGTFANDVEQAWKEQQEGWGAKLDYANELKIRILEEELKGAAGDPELIDLLYDLSENNWASLDGEAYVSVFANFDEFLSRKSPFDNIGETLSTLVDRIPTLIALPGFSDSRYAKMTPAQRADAKAKEQKAIDGRRYGEGIQKIVKRAKSGADFMRMLQADPWLWEQYQQRNPTKARYLVGIGKIAQSATSGKDFFDKLRRDPWLYEQYLLRNPDKRAGVQAGSEYFNQISKWGNLMQAGKFDQAEQYWKSLPAWVKDRYYQKHPEKRAKAARNASYMAAMEKWVNLAKANEHEAADKFFRDLPSWMRERYFVKHPEARFRLATDQRLMARAAAYFAADAANQPALLEDDDELRRFLQKYDGPGDTRRALIMVAYRQLTDPWLRRVYRDRYPEYFSKQSAAKRRISSVAADLKANPELLEGYKRALKLQTDAYIAQFRRSGVPPKPLEKEHLPRHARVRRERKRRAARFSRKTGGSVETTGHA